MGIQKKKCLVIHIVLFIVANFKIWVYKENMWIKRHIVLFIVTNFKIWVYKENMCLVIHIILFKKVKINWKSLMVKIYFLLVLFWLDCCRKPVYDTLLLVWLFLYLFRNYITLISMIISAKVCYLGIKIINTVKEF